MNISDLLPNDDTSKPSTPGQKKRSLLDIQQQLFLENIRSKIIKESANYRAQNRYLKEQYSQLLNQRQTGTWKSFYSLIISLKPLRSIRSNETIILGGWHRKTDTTNLKPPTSDLLNDLHLLKVHSEMLVRIKNSNFLKCIEWAEKNKSVFETVRELEKNQKPWDIDALREFSEKHPRKLIERVHQQLLFMDCSAFEFQPTVENPSLGWDNLFIFCFGYNEMPTLIKSAFPTHYLVIIGSKK